MLIWIMSGVAASFLPCLVQARACAWAVLLVVWLSTGVTTGASEA